MYVFGVRITGGTLRSRLIAAPKGNATRPTTDRVREALFGILDARGRVRGARVLDAFAGSGALGLEAISRGASEVTFVECAKPAIAVLRRNVDELGVTAQIVPKRIEAAILELGERGRFDLVLCDPPWVEIERLLPAIGSLVALVAEGGTLVLEHHKRTKVPMSLGGPGPGRTKQRVLRVVDPRLYGDTGLSFFE